MKPRDDGPRGSCERFDLKSDPTFQKYLAWAERRKARQEPREYPDMPEWAKEYVK